MIFGTIINEIDDYTLNNMPNQKSKETDDYTLNDTDDDVEPENEPEQEENNDNNTGEETDSDYSIDTPDEDPPRDAEEENNDDNTSEDSDYSMDSENMDNENNMDNNDDTLGADETENELIQKEKELFGKLTQQEMEIKNSELKSNFEKIYNVIDDIKEKIQRIPNNQTIQNVIDFINNKLNETQDDIEHYLYYTYDNKSYIQNVKQYNFYLLILKNIEKLFQEITPKTNN